MKKTQIIVLLSLLCFNFIHAQEGFSYTNKLKNSQIVHQYIPNVIIFKIKDQYRDKCHKDIIQLSELNNICKVINTQILCKKFPLHKKPNTNTDKYGRQLVDLSLIYEIHYESNIPIEKILSNIKKTGLVDYAEPHYLHKLHYLPNDIYADTTNPSNFRLYHLINIRAFQGWDESKGDSTVVVGIIDTGTDTDHADLASSIAYNKNDTIDGIDNDNDGFIDNYLGWDLGEFDNDPNVNQVVHGSHVSGISSASTDNGVGIAGTGFRCKFLPVKIDNADGYLTMSYEGIVYAADHGCDIINCSWGSKFGNGNFGQDIINYATINRNSLIIASAGNDNNDGVYYPASYQNVLSVAATNQDDEKWISQSGTGSNFNTLVDIAAPGDQIFSTLNGNTYAYSSGTSMAAPVASGLAAIVKSKFPEYSATQIGEQLRVTCDNIDTIIANNNYKNKLGKGRVNLYRALTEAEWPSIRLVELANQPETFFNYRPGDYFNLVCSFINYLDTASGISIKLSTENQYINITDSVYSPNVVYPMVLFDNQIDPFEIELDINLPLNEEVVFRLDYDNGIYSDFEFFSIVFNADFINIDTNRIKASLTSVGRLVYHEEFSDLNLGFLYDNNENLLYCGGLMLGTSSSKVSDNVYGSDNGFDQDFAFTKQISIISQTNIADMEVSSIFNDSLATFNSIGVEVIQNAYAWDNEIDNKYIILEYLIINNSPSLIYPLYAGFYSDWDIDKSSQNKANYEQSKKLAYVYPVGGGVHAGIKLLNYGSSNHYAIDNDGNGGNINLYDFNNFSNYEKYYALTNNRTEAGLQSNGNDVSHVITSGPYSVPPLDTIKVAFALSAGDYLIDLINSTDAAQNKYYQFINIREEKNFNSDFVAFPNPLEDVLHIRTSNEVNSKLKIEIVNSFGYTLKVEEIRNANDIIQINLTDCPDGLYILNIYFGNKMFSEKILKK